MIFRLVLGMITWLVLLLCISLILQVQSLRFRSIGKFRRQLRAIANSKKAEGTLATVHVGERREELSPSFFKDMKNILRARELVYVKTRVKKKKEAAALGEVIASATNSEVVQVVGHSILLFQSFDKEISDQLLRELGPTLLEVDTNAEED